MSFLSSLFGDGFKNPAREKWSGIIDAIHSQLAAERRAFFDACVVLLSDAPNITVKHRTMTPRIELVIVVYQLRFACDLIEGHQYFPPSDGSKFITMLYTDACHFGGVLERDELIRRYQRPDATNMGNDIFRFYHDFTSLLTGDAMPAQAAMILTDATIQQFVMASHLSTAKGFGDTETVTRLIETLKSS